tara:strand:+ start:627 stop:1790 length:1164 start_codon:yes stop_codon:yes gene_type:complete
MTSKNVLIIPCATQIGVEQYNSLKFNKYFKLTGASHNDSDDLFSNFIKLNYALENPKFIDEIKFIVKKYNIDILLPSHDEVLYILKNIPELENIIPGSSKKIINTCRFKSKTYDKLSTHPELLNSIPRYQTIKPGFLKPDKGQGSKGGIYINNDYVHCEYLPGKEYTVDCFTNHKNQLIYVNPRLRKTVINGISETTSIVDIPHVKQIATKINTLFRFKGSWFFQLKQDKNNNLKFLEIAPRIGGGSNINRLNGVNLTLSDLYQHLGYDINIVPQNLITEVNRKIPKYNLNFDTLLVDYDDTFGYIKDILYKLNKEIIIITRSKVKIKTIIPHKTIYVKENQNKSDIINSLNKPHAIFIDDSFKERKDVFLNCNIPCLTPEETQYLI